MAELVGVYAASHAPLIARDWERLPAALRARLNGAFESLGARVRAAAPDVLIEIAPDHWVNFFLDNLPAVCIGVGTVHEPPPEPFLREFPYRAPPGDPQLASHLVRSAFSGGFEPAISHRLRLDHGFCIPLWRMELKALPRIVPMIVNDLEPPMLAIGRCLAWGKLVADAVASYPAPMRVAVLASGGLSHSIGEPTMGAIDERYDRACIAAFASGDDARLVATVEAGLEGAGNGAHEIRNWVVAHGAARGRRFDLIDYFPAAEVYVGCGFAAWT